MGTVEREGVALHYETLGEGPAVLLTHGYSASTAMWKSNVAALADAGYRIIVWDMRGHGQTASPDEPEKYSEAATVEDMAAVLDAAGAKTAVIGGMSLGGYMTLNFYRRYPERCRALMLIDTGPGFKQDAARDKWNVYAREKGDDLLKRGLPALSSSTEAHLQPQNFKGLRNAAYGMLAQTHAKVIQSLPEIAVPTLVVVGDRDEPFIAASDYMAKKIPGAAKITIADAGHASNVDQPAQFNAAVLEFLARLP